MRRNEHQRERETESARRALREEERREHYAREHPAGYLLERLPGSRPTEDGSWARGSGYREGGFDHGRGVWGAPGEEQASAHVGAHPLAGRPSARRSEQPRFERVGHPGIADEPGYGAHGAMPTGATRPDLRTRAPRRWPRNYQRADATILEEICERMIQEGDLDASDVEVSVRGGEARLRGSVPERWMKFRAEEICEATAGVTDIDNRLHVSSAPVHDR